jgi:hypothetical protein
VRLSLNPPIATEVALSESERAALDVAMAKAGFAKGLGTFLRAVALRAAKGYAPAKGGSLAETLEDAAAASRQNVAEWIRNVALVAIGDSDLLAQLQNAKDAYTSGNGPESWPENAED